MRIAVLALLCAAACGDDGHPAADAPHDTPLHDTPIDTLIDTSAGPCSACTLDQQCVAFFGGTCQSMGVQCVGKVEGCESLTCSAACEAAYCTSPYQCQDSPCPGVPAGAFGCFGP
ncbi:MAG TPA: hypothetical protein VGM88_22115 [Kofleriaceae bacterium]|jgi:hypothetical protein